MKTDVYISLKMKEMEKRRLEMVASAISDFGKDEQEVDDVRGGELCGCDIDFDYSEGDIVATVCSPIGYITLTLSANTFVELAEMIQIYKKELDKALKGEDNNA